VKKFLHDIQYGAIYGLIPKYDSTGIGHKLPLSSFPLSLPSIHHSLDPCHPPSRPSLSLSSPILLPTLRQSPPHCLHPFVFPSRSSSSCVTFKAFKKRMSLSTLTVDPFEERLWQVMGWKLAGWVGMVGEGWTGREEEVNHFLTVRSVQAPCF
jgi:hypothetical protein